MGDLQLNKAQKFFYFRTRISLGHSLKNKERRFFGLTLIEQNQVWRTALNTLSELKNECGIEVYGLALDSETIQILFSTAYFNENILVLDWEMRIRKDMALFFDRPITCEPISDEFQVKRLLIEMYAPFIEVQNNAIQWKGSHNSLKIILEGGFDARIFNDPLKIIFQPSVVLKFKTGSGGRPSTEFK